MDKETALEILRKHRDRMPSAERTALGTLIPELKEREDEKKLKESLMQYLWDMYHKDFCPPKPSMELCEKWIAYLEKQGECKSITKMPVSEELYEHIRNTRACIDDAVDCNNIKDVRDYLAQAKDDVNKALDMVKQKPTAEEMKTILQTEYEKGRADVIAEFEQGWTEEDTDTLKWICRIIFRAKQDRLITQKEESFLGTWIDKWLNHSPERKEQGEQNTIVNKTPSKEMILAVWELGNIWKELTEGNPYTEYGTQLQYIQNHWSESPYYEKLKQNHTDKITPKFKIGDWVVKNDDSSVCVDYSICKITKVENGNYTIESIYGYKGYITFKTFEKDYHIFTIEEDAKDGDVVVNKSDGTIGIFRSIGHHPDGGSYNDPSYCFLHCRYDDGFFYAGFENGNTMDSDDVIPATKKQRERLEKAIKEAGYEWDAENKELRKLNKK